MSRGDGFEIADVDVGMLDDTKFRQLARAHVGEEALIARCAVGYTAALLRSWQEGDRVALVDAAPAWLTELDELVTVLVAHRLLDDAGRIPEGSWQRWFTPAFERREGSRERWRKAARSRRDRTAPGGSEGPSGDVRADSSLTPSVVTGSVRSVPSVPTVPSSPSSPSPLRAAAADAGGFVAELARVEA